MGASVPFFGGSNTDAAVTEWLERKGIQPDDVLAYTVVRSTQDSTISLLFVFDDAPKKTAEKEE